MTTSLVWLRDDLRLGDNPALHKAANTSSAICVLYILEESPVARALGGASRWWLHVSLKALGAALAARGNRLILRRGDPRTLVPRLVEELGAGQIFWNRRTDGAARRVDQEVKAGLKARGLHVESFNGNLLLDPVTFRNGSGQPFKVFTPFWKAAQASLDLLPEPLPAPETLPPPDMFPESDALEGWRLLPVKPDWAGGLVASWQPGEEGAARALARFMAKGLAHYADGRDFPARAVTSRLSPHLRFGEISPLRIWHTARASAAPAADKAKFLAEVGWREFSHHLLSQFPDLATRNFNPRFDGFDWRRNDEAFTRWCRGETGVPIVDAGMRELWQTGTMHNRVRMIVASFLTKHLLIDWREGERWFWDTLVDADPASNPASWQWVAGSGADAAPYFRIFNPVLQGEKFDPQGDYIRRFVPELAPLPPSLIHKPFEAVAWERPRGYPEPVVDLKLGRERALAAYSDLRSQN